MGEKFGWCLLVIAIIIIVGLMIYNISRIIKNPSYTSSDIEPFANENEKFSKMLNNKNKKLKNFRNQNIKGVKNNKKRNNTSSYNKKSNEKKTIKEKIEEELKKDGTVYNQPIHITLPK